jgi:hypothetical protein
MLGGLLGGQLFRPLVLLLLLLLAQGLEGPAQPGVLCLQAQQRTLWQGLPQLGRRRGHGQAACAAASSPPSPADSFFCCCWRCCCWRCCCCCCCCCSSCCPGCIRRLAWGLAAGQHAQRLPQLRPWAAAAAAAAAGLHSRCQCRVAACPQNLHAPHGHVLAPDGCRCLAGQGPDVAGHCGIRCCVHPHPQRALLLLLLLLLPRPPASCCCPPRLLGLCLHGVGATPLIRCRLAGCRRAAVPHQLGRPQRPGRERARLVELQVELHRPQQHLGARLQLPQLLRAAHLVQQR